MIDIPIEVKVLTLQIIYRIIKFCLIKTQVARCRKILYSFIAHLKHWPMLLVGKCHFQLTKAEQQESLDY